MMILHMNDFTKEELENLQYCMRQMKIHIDNYDETYNKIQSMIDNYCDHVSDGNIYWSNPPKSKCNKCGIYYDY
jgi:hypothetical protein